MNHPYFSRPIPDLSPLHAEKAGYRQWPIDTENPLYRERCVEIKSLGIAGLNHYHREHNPPYDGPVPGSIPELFLRESVARALQGVNEQLLPFDLELFVHDAWRPPAIQSHFHDRWFPDQLRAVHPDWSDAQIGEEANRYWAAGPATLAEIDPASPPPHATGGAVDLTLRHRGDRELLYMGMIFDDVSAESHPDAFEQDAGGLSFSRIEARKNRRLLYWMMIDAGFVVNPTEWWHFSMGDQMWAKLTSARTGSSMPARYSVIDPFA